MAKKSNLFNKDGSLNRSKISRMNPEVVKARQPGKPGPKRMPLMMAINKELDKVVAGRMRVRRVAESFVDQAEKGSFAHAKEILDRQEGKVPTRIGDPNGQPMKMYIGMPLEGDNAP